MLYSTRLLCKPTGCYRSTSGFPDSRNRISSTHRTHLSPFDPSSNPNSLLVGHNLSVAPRFYCVFPLNEVSSVLRDGIWLYRSPNGQSWKDAMTLPFICMQGLTVSWIYKSNFDGRYDLLLILPTLLQPFTKSGFVPVHIRALAF